MKNKVHFSSKSDEWETPPELFATLNKEFGFTLDAAASPANHKCKLYLSQQDDALGQSWEAAALRDTPSGLVEWPRASIWLNPPYSRHLQARFIRKARDEAAKFRGPLVCCLIPARPDTKVWQETIFPCASEIRFISGRVRFVGASAGAPFPSAVVIFGQDNERQLIRGWNWETNKFTSP